MTSESRPALVGALFPSRESAKAAADDLRAAGFGDEELATAEWLDGRYVIASHAGRKIAHGVWIGALAGTVLGAVVGAVLTALLWQSATVGAALLVGGTFGAFGGAVLGAYFGLVRHRPHLWDEEDWTHLEVEEGEVLIVFATGRRPEAVREIFDRHGGRRVEPIHPE